LAHQLDLSHTTTSTISLNLSLSLPLQIKPSQLTSSNQSLFRFFLLSSFLQLSFFFSHSNHSQLFFLSFSCCSAQFLTRCVFTFRLFPPVPEMGVAQNGYDAEEGTLEIGMGGCRFCLSILR